MNESPLFHQKEPYVPSKEPYIPSKKPYIPSKEPYTPLKEPYIPDIQVMSHWWISHTCDLTQTNENGPYRKDK